MTRLLSAQTVAERMGYKSWRTLKRRAKRGTLPFDLLREGRRFVVRSSDFEAYLRGLRPAFTPPPTADVDVQELIRKAVARCVSDHPRRGRFSHSSTRA